MDEIDDRILANERRQMEQIRELDMEELQVEEVDGNASSDDEVIISGHGNGDAGPFGGFTYNTCLASRHTYLGDVDDTHGRLSFLDGGAILKLPMFYLQGVVLFPEATLPLRVIQPRFIAALEKALNNNDAPYTIGVVLVQWQWYEDERTAYIASTGTTAEIRQYRRLEDGSYNVVARGQQRFRLKQRWVDAEGAPCGKVQIIMEDTPLRTPKCVSGSWASISNPRNSSCHRVANLVVSPAKRHGRRDAVNDWECMSTASFISDCSTSDTRVCLSADSSNSPYTHERFDESSSDDEFMHGQDWRKKMPDSTTGTDKYHNCGNIYENDKCDWESLNDSPPGKRLDGREKSGKNLPLSDSRCVSRASSSFWPLWVFQMYDSYSLAQRAADMWRQIIGKPSVDNFVRKPDTLSFYIASKLPMSEGTRQELLEIDGISYRLRREIELLEGFNVIHCRNCGTLIAKRSDMVVMSSDGPLNAYVNPHGFVHEIITVSETNGLALIGGPVKEHSWFPGYAWTIANCTTCESNMGWLFTAIKRNLLPKSFWGIRSSQVTDDKLKRI